MSDTILSITFARVGNAEPVYVAHDGDALIAVAGSVQTLRSQIALAGYSAPAETIRFACREAREGRPAGAHVARRAEDRE